MKHNIASNNFDLIRLFAASQVAFLHVMSYLSWPWHSAPAIRFLELFPGVPIFFFISGFLISRSYEKTGTISDYSRNRALRIFPALHVCVFLNLVLVWITGYFVTVDAGFLDIALLYVAKTTIFQFYNPDFMRQFGDGVLNGSLWTICVELQFYFVTPIIYAFAISGSRLRTNIVLILLIVTSIIINRLLYASQSDYGSLDYWKIVRVSFLPWIYMFLVGVLAQRNFLFLARLMKKHLLLLALPVYVLYTHFMNIQGFHLDNSISPLLFFPLVVIVIIAAYSAPDLANKTLRGQDISYGIYIYHVPIMNMFLFYHYKDKLVYTALVLLVTVGFALASWFLVERPCLKRKHHATHPVTAVSSGL